MEKQTIFFKNFIFIFLLIFFSIILIFFKEISTNYQISLNQTIFTGIILFVILIKLYLNSNKQTEDTENEFIKIVNHTFRTPLTGLNWLMKELKSDIDKDTKENFIQRAENSIEKLISITDLFAGIKSLDEQSSYNFKATSIRDIIENSIIKYKNDIKSKGIQLTIPTFNNMPLITLDLNKITFVIDTIFENSVFYNKENGLIHLETSFDKDILKIIFKDSGIGFSKKEQEKIFNKFYRTEKATLANPNGMGLKLYLSKKIIKKHNGKIKIASNGEDLGSELTIELPLNK